MRNYDGTYMRDVSQRVKVISDHLSNQLKSYDGSIYNLPKIGNPDEGTEKNISSGKLAKEVCNISSSKKSSG